MKKIRINELARELEVKAHEILDRLPELGVAEKKTHSSSIDEDVAIKLRRLYGFETPDLQPESEASEILAEPSANPAAVEPETEVVREAEKAPSGPTAWPVETPAARKIAEHPVPQPASVTAPEKPVV